MSAFAGLNPRRICIIKPSALGDVVQALPVLGPLRTRFPQAAISWVISKGLADLVTDHPRINDVISFDRRGGVRQFARLLQTLRARRFDLVIDLQGLMRTGLMTRATAAPVRVGLETAREGSRLSCTTILHGTGRDVPARMRYWRIAEELGVADAPASAEILLTPADHAFAATAIAGLARPIVAVCPGAQWITKRWPPESFVGVAARAHREWGASIVIMGASDERDLCHAIEQQLSAMIPAHAVLNLAGSTGLRQLAAILQASHWVIANDSGPMHLADAVGTPVLGLFTCTSPWLSGPPIERHELLSTRLLCAGSYHKSCPNRGAAKHACHTELSIDRAWERLQRLAVKTRRAAA